VGDARRSRECPHSPVADEAVERTDWAQARKTALIFAQAWTVVAPSNELRAKALVMVERYDLRAADAFQLAAALEWCVDVPQGRKLLTADARLFQAALLSGFDAVNI
jgi:predicted nucleic acid-binding protein